VSVIVLSNYLKFDVHRKNFMRMAHADGALTIQLRP
jgi:hypothetical protein